MIVAMLNVRLVVTALALALAVSACKVKEESSTIPAPPNVAAPPADALRTPSGIASKVLIVGLGSIHPTERSTVKVHYTGWTTDGKMFDSSVVGGVPAEFPLDGVIAGWTEAVQLMVVGEKRRFWIPGHLAYDNIPDPNAPKGMLVFDIELIDIR